MTCKPGSAKPVVSPPQQWKLSDALKRDPIKFLQDIYYFATLTGQDAVYSLLHHVDPNIQDAATHLSYARPGAVSWHQDCETFLSLIG